MATFTPTSKITAVTFTVRDDDKPEDKETFYLRLFLIDFSILLGDPNVLTVTIEASDDAYGVFGFLDVSLTISILFKPLYLFKMDIATEQTLLVLCIKMNID